MKNGFEGAFAGLTLGGQGNENNQANEAGKVAQDNAPVTEKRPHPSASTENGGRRRQELRELLARHTANESGTISVRPEKTEALAHGRRHELMNPFELSRKLYDFASEQPRMEHCYTQYSDPEAKDNPYAVKLPAQFGLLVRDYPGSYYVVGYENRTGTYYKQGTRQRYAVLSTVPLRSMTDGKVREITISEPDASESDGNIQFFAVKESLLNESFVDINTAPEDQADKPHGSAKLTYGMRPTGEKQLVESEFNRLDEDFFEWQGRRTPVRWVRDLSIKNQGESQNMETEYRDLYIIGRHHQDPGHRDKQAYIKTKIAGDLNNPKSITVELGLPSGSGKTIYENPELGIKIILHENRGGNFTEPEELMDILKEDPNYAFLFDPTNMTKRSVMEVMSAKFHALTNDWDKTSSVFGQMELPEAQRELKY